MRRPLAGPRGRAGFSMLEMLIALVMLSIVMGAAVSVFRSQSRYVRKGGASMDLNQNARFVMTTLERVVRTLGAGTPNDQPMLVYADQNTLIFNANYASNIPDASAVYINPDLPATATGAITTATPITLPNTTIVYPPQNYTWGTTPSRAETIMFYLRPDSSSVDPSDFVLLEKVNNTRSELVARNLRAYPGRPFFEYWYDSTTAGGEILSRPLPAARLPVRHTAPIHASAADLGPSALADSLKMVRVNFVVTNGLTVIDSASRRFSTMIMMTNNGLLDIKTCGAAPLNAQAFVASSPATGAVQLTWLPSLDETAGEQDVSGYNLYYRLAGAPNWETWTTQAAGQPSYSITAGGFTPDADYSFAIAAQDCTPTESSTLSTTTVHVTP